MEDLSGQIEEHMHSFHHLAGEVKDVGSALLFSNRSLPSPTYNHATRVRVAESEANKLIADVIRYYQSMSFKACFMLYPTTHPAAFADSLLNAEFELIDEENAMIFKGKTVNARLSSDVHVTEIDGRQLDVWTKVLMRGYSLPENFQGIVQEMFTKVSRHNGSRFYQAYFQEKPVGSCLLYAFNDVATIYTVATVPEHSKKGVATALINRVIVDSSKAGCSMLYLLAGKGSDAERLYGKLGFKGVFSRKLYELHPKKQE
ncbi:GNAT family N-acetyltransferase [Candidatus Bathyarchaeota archaeon]|nr:GNAT family N-acetyltransferase [Candidatus Bathyarchaeota archaeon]